VVTYTIKVLIPLKLEMKRLLDLYRLPVLDSVYQYLLLGQRYKSETRTFAFKRYKLFHICVENDEELAFWGKLTQKT